MTETTQHSHSQLVSTKIFSHYSSPNELNYLPIDLKELEKSMAEARRSYLAWKEMQQQILVTIQGLAPQDKHDKK